MQFGLDLLELGVATAFLHRRRLQLMVDPKRCQAERTDAGRQIACTQLRYGSPRLPAQRPRTYLVNVWVPGIGWCAIVTTDSWYRSTVTPRSLVLRRSDDRPALMPRRLEGARAVPPARRPICRHELHLRDFSMSDVDVSRTTSWQSTAAAREVERHAALAPARIAPVTDVLLL